MPRNRLTKMKITRVSLVDRPAGIGAEVVLAKRDATEYASGIEDDVAKKQRIFSDEERMEMADSGEAMPDGSFPIPDADALRRAIIAYPRAKDPVAAVAHIKRRAKDLGLSEMVTGLDVSKSDDRNQPKNNSNFSGRGNMSQAFAGQTGKEAMNDDIAKGGNYMMDDEDMMDSEDMMDDEMPMPKKRKKKMMKSDDAETTIDEILKSLPDEAISYIERLEDIIIDMRVAAEAEVAKADEDDEDDDELLDLSDDDDDDDDDDDEDNDDEEAEAEADDFDAEDEVDFDVDAEVGEPELAGLLKSADRRTVAIVKSYIAKAEKKASAAEAIAKRERDLRLHREYVAKAADLTMLPIKQDDLVTIFKTVADKAPEIEEQLTALLKAAHGALKESDIFKSEGSDAIDGSTAIAKFDAVIKEIRTSNPNMTSEQAFAKALDMHPELYDEYININNKGR